MGIGLGPLARAAAGAAGSDRTVGGPSRVGDMVVGQLGDPKGLLGRVVLAQLDRRNRALIDGCVQAIAPRTGQAVADIGFGGGRGLEALIDRVGLTGIVTGVEPSELARARARKRFADEIALDRVRILSGVVSRLPLDDASQNGIISVNTAYFWADLDAGVREIRRALAPGACMAIGIGGLDDQRRLRFETRARRIVAADDLADTLRRADLTGVAQATPRGPEGPAIVRGYRLA